MTTHQMRLDPEPYKKVRQGKKTIELRLYDEKRRKIAVGDEIEFINSEDETHSFSVSVTALHKFPSFEELYKSLPLENCGYTEETIALASHHDMDKYYSPEKQKLYGVVGIEIKTKQSMIGDALNELIEIQENEEDNPDWINYLKVEAWQEKYLE